MTELVMTDEDTVKIKKKQQVCSTGLWGENWQKKIKWG